MICTLSNHHIYVMIPIQSLFIVFKENFAVVKYFETVIIIRVNIIYFMSIEQNYFIITNIKHNFPQLMKHVLLRNTAIKENSSSANKTKFSVKKHIRLRRLLVCNELLCVMNLGLQYNTCFLHFTI